MIKKQSSIKYCLIIDNILLALGFPVALLLMIFLQKMNRVSFNLICDHVFIFFNFTFL